MSGESFGIRRVERDTLAALDANAEEVARCIALADHALSSLRDSERRDAAILSDDARLLYVASVLWTRDADGGLARTDADALHAVGVRVLGECRGDVTAAAHVLAAAAATGLLVRLVALEVQ
jgi:hypothetical protein